MKHLQTVNGLERNTIYLRLCRHCILETAKTAVILSVIIIRLGRRSLIQ